MEYHLDLWTGWIRCRCDAKRKQVGVKQLYSQVPPMVWVSWSSRQAEFSSSCSQSSSSSRSWGQDIIVRASTRQRAWALRTPVEQPSRMRKKCCYNTEELGVNMWQSVPSPTHLSYIININPFATLSRIKCERYIFLNKCVRSSLLLCFCMYMYSCIMAIQHYQLLVFYDGIWFRRTKSSVRYAWCKQSSKPK